MPDYRPSPDLDQSLTRFQTVAGAAGVLLLAVSIVGAFFTPAQFFHAYLFGYLFWLGLALGSMGLLMTQYLTGGAWGVVTRRTYESASRTLPLLAVLFVPILFGVPWLYPWSHSENVLHDEGLHHRSGYMNLQFFIVRAVIYFAIWLLLSSLLNRWSGRQDEDAAGSSPQLHSMLERISPPGLILYVFTVTFASVDWAESLFSDWYSTIWGFLFVAGQGITALGLGILTLSLLARYKPFAEVVHAKHLHDLGKLLLTFVMLWAYFSFSQLLIVWAGNLHTEIPWYLPRWHGPWAGMGGAIALLEFAVPFFLLLSRPLKRNWRALCIVVGLLLVMRIVDLYWIVMPAFHRAFAFHWLQLTVPLAQGGLWTAFFLWHLRRRPLLPLGAPNLQAALEHGS